MNFLLIVTVTSVIFSGCNSSLATSKEVESEPSRKIATNSALKNEDQEIKPGSIVLFSRDLRFSIPVNCLGGLQECILMIPFESKVHYGENLDGICPKSYCTLSFSGIPLPPGGYHSHWTLNARKELRVKAVGNVMSHDEYDACGAGGSLIYNAWHGRSSIEFELLENGIRATLSCHRVELYGSISPLTDKKLQEIMGADLISVKP